MTSLLAAGAMRRTYNPALDIGFEADVPGLYPVPTPGVRVTIPTYDGSGSSIHPSAVDMGRRWHGYRWWFSDTPYPGGADTYENPSIFASNDRATWVVPAGVTNPLAPDPDGAGTGYNSDDDLVWDADRGRLVCYWRRYIGATGYLDLRAAYSYDGATWVVVPDPIIALAAEPRLSPVICQAGPGAWRMWCFGNAVPPAMWTAPTSLGPWTLAGTCTLSGYAGYNWHGDIIRHSGQWLGIFSNKTECFPMASTDGLAWNVGGVLSGIASYRATMAPSTETGEMDIWSSRTWNQVFYYRAPLTAWTSLLP